MAKKFSELGKEKALAQARAITKHNDYHLKVQLNTGVFSIGCSYGKHYVLNKADFNPLEDNDD